MDHNANSEEYQGQDYLVIQISRVARDIRDFFAFALSCGEEACPIEREELEQKGIEEQVAHHSGKYLFRLMTSMTGVYCGHERIISDLTSPFPGLEPLAIPIFNI
jgi:hypothetical protein